MNHSKGPQLESAQDYIVAGKIALKTAKWSDAKALFEKALAEEDLPEAHDGIGIAFWWLNEIPEAHYHRTLAYNGFKKEGALGYAIMLACWLGREQVFLHGNLTAMKGWFSRADRLAEQIPPSIEIAWCHMLQASMTASPTELAAIANDVIHTAQRFKDNNLEAFALAFCGLAQVSLAQITAGMSQLDEAMTMATGGEVTDFMVISEIFCVMLSACETAHDLMRSEHWCQVASRFAEQYHCPFLSAYCRTTYGSLLTAIGNWQDAELALVEAIQAFETGHRGLRIHAVTKLADLLVCQGRLEEAEVMLAGLEDQNSALIPLARLHLAQGQSAQAKAILSQALELNQTLSLAQLPTLYLLVEVYLALNAIESAHKIATEIASLSRQAQNPILTAQAELARGQINLYAGNDHLALENFNSALTQVKAYGQSLLAGRIRLHMAQAIKVSDPIGSIAWAKAAYATFERIGALRDAMETDALLRQLGVSRNNKPRLKQMLTSREIEILAFLAQGLTNREIAKRLVISSKTVEHHVSHILSKLNLRSRTEVAAFALSGKLEEMTNQPIDGKK